MRKEGYQMDEMTPLERRQAIEEGRDYDRIPCVPFLSEFKCIYAGISVWDFWHNPDKMAETEVMAFERFGYDRIVIGPNSRGITEALGGAFIYPEQAVPHAGEPYLQEYEMLTAMEPVDAQKHPRIQTFARAAEKISERKGNVVPIEASIGGPFTIAANLRGTETLLRDCRKYPEAIHHLLRVITDSQKSCIDMAAVYGLGIAMADPVANPALIGPRLYEQYVYPYTKELTDYVFRRTGKKVSLHMCGKTYSIWKYLCRYELNELSLDNIIDLNRAVEELGNVIPIAGNVDPVGVIMNGTKEEIIREVNRCIMIGEKAEKGYILATGCDIPERTAPQQIDYFMEAARRYKIQGMLGKDI